MAKRVVVAIIGSLPVAIVAGVSLGLAIDVGGAISTIFFWIVWGASTYYAVREVELKRIFGRTAIAYAVAAFSLPLTAAVFGISAFGEVEDAVESSEGALEGFFALVFGAALLEIFLVIAVVVGMFGVVTGLIAVLIARHLLERHDAEPPQSTGLPVRATLRRFHTEGLRQVRLDNKATVLGLALVALCLAIIAGIAVYGILVSTDQTPPALTAAPTPIPVVPTLNPAIEPAPEPTPAVGQAPVPVVPTLSPAAAPGPIPTSAPESVPTAVVGPTPDPCDIYLQTDLFGAMSEGPEAVRCVIRFGADVNARDDRGRPMVYWAIIRDNPEIVQILVDAGSDVNARDDDGDPMLYWAIIGNDDAVELARMLVDAGADVNARDDNGNPMLFWAVIDNDDAVELARILVDAGADVNARDDNDRSMLYWANTKDNPEVIRILVDAGAEESP